MKGKRERLKERWMQERRIKREEEEERNRMSRKRGFGKVSCGENQQIDFSKQQAAEGQMTFQTNKQQKTSYEQKTPYFSNLSTASTAESRNNMISAEPSSLASLSPSKGSDISADLEKQTEHCDSGSISLAFPNRIFRKARRKNVDNQGKNGDTQIESNQQATQMVIVPKDKSSQAKFKHFMQTEV